MKKTLTRLILPAVLSTGLWAVNLCVAGDTGVVDAVTKPQSQFIYKTTSERALTVDVDYPPGWKSSDKRAAIVFFFGGGWKTGTPKQFQPQAEYFAQRGLVCARADYRVRSRDGVVPTQCVEDAISAMRWVRGHAAQLGIDPNRIVAAGGSAGGHLAACTYFVDGISDPKDDKVISPKPDAMLLYNPVVDLRPLYATRDSNMVAGLSEKVAREISPTWHVNKNAPPIFIIDGTADRFNSQIREFIARNKSLGVSIDAAFTEGQPHGFFNKPPWLAKTTKDADAFLQRIGYLGKTPVVPLPTKKSSSADDEKGE